MKVAFAGTPEFAATILGGLLNSGHEIGLVISQPDPRRGRGRKTAPTPVAELARAHDLPLVQPARISDVVTEISANDVLTVAAYGQILRPDTLDATRHGAYNVHASLLPAYRGAAPIERAIMAGETVSGVSIMKMDEGLDTGPVALQRTVEIRPETTGGALTASLATLGAEALLEGLGYLESGSLNLTPQVILRATYAPKLSDEDKVVDWTEDAARVRDRIRALAPRVGARTFHPSVEGPVKLWDAKVVDGAVQATSPGRIYADTGRLLVGCGVGTLEVLELQMPGGRRVGAVDFLRGHALGGAFLA